MMWGVAENFHFHLKQKTKQVSQHPESAWYDHFSGNVCKISLDFVKTFHFRLLKAKYVNISTTLFVVLFITKKCLMIEESDWICYFHALLSNW